jgi:chemotaxis protein methyltransferase CheR
MEPRLSDDEFALFRDLIKVETGIALNTFKRPLVQARLARLVRQLRLRTYRDYYEYLVAHDATEEERSRFINAVTTNKTGFFREPYHFEYLRRVWIPALRARAHRTGNRRIRIWSAGCSTGEEAYSIAMTLADGLASLAEWDVRILASDIDTAALAVAQEGTYRVDRLRSSPVPVPRRYLHGSTSARAGLVGVAPWLRELVVFRRINLVEDPWPIRTRFDLVFLRNVVIYFDRPTKNRLFERLEDVLKDEGLLVLGHSESLLGSGSGLRFVGQTIYQRDPAARAASGSRG